MAVQSPTSPADTFVESWQEWHSGHEVRRADAHGFLVVTSLHWLDGDAQRFDDAPGEWSAGPDGVRVVLAEGEELIVGGVAVHGAHSFGVIGERNSLFPVSGDAVIEVAKRGGHDILRPRHPENPLRVGHTGTPTFAPDPRWAVMGRQPVAAHRPAGRRRHGAPVTSTGP